MLNADVDVAAGELFLDVDDFGDHLNDRVASLPLHIQILPQQRDIDLRLRRVLASLKDLLHSGRDGTHGQTLKKVSTSHRTRHTLARHGNLRHLSTRAASILPARGGKDG